MITIRKYEEKDRDNLFKICVATSGLPTETQKDLDFLNLLYNDYYAVVEPQNCFVAVNEDDETVGYILCAENFDRYYKTFKGLYMPQIKKLGFNFFTMAMGEISVHRLFKKKYPAHLHIDILPEAQRQGLGTKLIDALTSHLKAKGINNVSVLTISRKSMGYKFYTKYGFRKVGAISNDRITMTYDIK